MAYNNNQRTDNGSNPQAVQQNGEIGKAGRSWFDESMVHTTTGDMGALIPVDLFKGIIGDDLELKTSFMIDTINPMVRPMLSRVRAYVHYYFMRCTDLWKGYQNFITTGRTGNINKTIPYIDVTDESAWKHQYTENGNWVLNDQNYSTTWDSPQSLMSYLGYGWNAWQKDREEHTGVYMYPYGYVKNQYRTLPFNYRGPDGDQTTEVQNIGTLTEGAKLNALPFAMYQRIYRDYYLNKNLSQNNKNWFPDDEDEFIMAYNTTGANSLTGWKQNGAKASIIVHNEQDNNKNDDPALPVLRYRQWRGDYFTEALPWQYRGDEPQMSSFVEIDDIKINGNMPRSTDVTPNTRIDIDRRNLTGGILTEGAVIGDEYASLSVAYTANQIREVFILAEWKERMAKTNGDYNNMMLAQFGENPHIHDRTPTYIGGCVVDLNTSVITQTSGDTDESTLGEQGGRMSAICNADIGTFHVPDNGYIMAIMSIVPDVTYSAQGLDRTLKGGTTMAEEYFPLFANLEPQGVTQSELFNELEADTELFGWQERFANLKYRRNRNSGLISLPPEEDSEYTSRTWARHFTSAPKLNNAFVTMAPPAVRRDMFTAPTEPMFLIQFASRVGATRHIPYTSKQAGLTGYAM